MVDAPDLGSGAARCGGSSPLSRTTSKIKDFKMDISNEANLPTRFGTFIIQSFRESLPSGEKSEHLVVRTKKIGAIPLVRVHSECLTGDVFASRKCDCGDELSIAMEQIAQNSDKDGGMIIYLRQEGRGIGLFNKINAYALQDKGFDTVEANEALGFASDNRNYAVVGEIFKHFNIKEVRLLTNNPKKIEAISKFVKVNRAEIFAPKNEFNTKYLAVKKAKLGHLL